MHDREIEALVERCVSLDLVSIEPPPEEMWALWQVRDVAFGLLEKGLLEGHYRAASADRALRCLSFLSKDDAVRDCRALMLSEEIATDPSRDTGTRSAAVSGYISRLRRLRHMLRKRWLRPEAEALVPSRAEACRVLEMAGSGPLDHDAEFKVRLALQELHHADDW